MSVNMKNYKTFEQLAEDIQKLNDKWSTSTAGTDKYMTFAGIQSEMQELRMFINTERKWLYEDIDKLKDVWSKQMVADKKRDLTAQFDEMTQKIVSFTKADISALIALKSEKIGNMLSTAPTEEQLRLLSALQMRGDLDAVEVHRILPQFFENYHSMRVLQAISEQNGIKLNLPVQLDCRTMYETLNEAGDYLMRACDELPKKWNDMHIMFHAFYTVNADEKDKQYDIKYQEYIDMFDNTPQLQDVKPEKQKLSKGEQARLDWYFRDIKSLDITDPADYTLILQKVGEVMQANPDMVESIRLSEYKSVVEDVEYRIEEEKKKQIEEEVKKQIEEQED